MTRSAASCISIRFLPHLPWRHAKEFCALRQIAEERAIGACHEDLAAELGESREQRLAAARIEMGRDLVEQNERRDAAHLRHEMGMRHDEADQQGLLLAGRGAL